MKSFASFKYKTELFFLITLVSSICYTIYKIKFTFFIPLILLFIFSKRKSLIVIILILVLHWLIPKIDVITYTTYSYSKGIHTVYPKFLRPGTIIFKDKNYSFSVLEKIYSFRDKLCNDLYFDSGGEISLLQAVLFGNKSFLKNVTKDMFTITGTLHLLAISGLHVAIIIGLIFSIFFFLPLKIRYLITSLFLIFFIILTGFKITVIRASLFAIIILTALFFNTETKLKKLIFLIAALFLLITPEMIKDISFILSFSAVIGILYFIEQEKSTIHNFINASLGATIFTTPFILYFFGNFNYLGILNTIILLPIFYFLILLGFIAVFAKSYLIAPISFLELFLNKLIETLYNLTYPFFFLNKINFHIFLFSLLILFYFTVKRQKILVFLLLLLPFFRIFPSNITIFPNMIRSKGFIKISKTYNEIFFKGFYRDFKYKFLPLVAKTGCKNFDYGNIKIYDGKNFYLKIKKKRLKDICINETMPYCKIVYFTRANKISKKLLSKDKLFIIYQNKIKAPNIIELKRTKCIVLNDKGVIIDDPICK